jgi:XisI protein
MDPLDPWRDALERILTEHASIPGSYGDVRSEVVADRKRDRYLLVDVGWKGLERVHEALIHADLIDGKIWIQYDGYRGRHRYPTRRRGCSARPDRARVQATGRAQVHGLRCSVAAPC